MASRVPMQNAPPPPMTLPSHGPGPSATPDIENVVAPGVEPWHLHLLRCVQALAIVSQDLKELIEVQRASTNCVIYTVLNPGVTLPSGPPNYLAPFASRWIQVTNRNVAGASDALVYLYTYRGEPISNNIPIAVPPGGIRKIETMARGVNVLSSVGNLSAVIEFWG